MEPNLTDVNVEEIMKKIKAEVAKRKSASVIRPPDKSSTVFVQIPKPVEPTMKETKLYVFAKWLGQKMKRLGFGNVVSRGKKLMPKRLKYNAAFLQSDFTKYHDEEFLEKAYSGILKRNPDQHGLDYFLSKLRRGKLNKTEILGRIRYSKEGREKGVKIKGLFFPFFLNTFYNVPVLGYIFRLITAVARLPIILRNIHEYEAFTNARFTENNKHFNGLCSHLEDEVSQISTGLAHKSDAIEKELANKADIPLVDGIQSDLLSKAQAIDAISASLGTKADLSLVNEVNDRLGTKANLSLVNEMNDRLGTKADLSLVNEMNDRLGTKADLNTLSEAVGGLRKETETQLKSLLKEIGNQKVSILDQHRMLTLLFEEIRGKLSAPTSKKRIEKMLGEEFHLLDALYVTLEDEFRGLREEIKERQKTYLSYVERVNGGKEAPPILDVGCGRGEWLELLRDNGFTAKGVDINRMMVQQCQELGLDVSESDMIEYLKHQRTRSLRAITGFHIVEHLSLKTLISLLDQSFRVLKPGGIIIFETPNPENLIVSVCNFYFDPTHNKPIPPKLLKFLAEARGFVNAEIIRLHPYRFFSDKTKTFEGMEEVIQLCEKEQDYSVIAYKA
jgi:2-polyprenyl-3-methyl-5-hydroxy-6-metoxy-1,4-benzoquinol methylase